MDNPQFPPNSDKSKKGPSEEKKVTSVVQGKATRRKKGLGKQFRETFVAGDAKTAMSYVIFEVALPSARDAIWEMGSQFLEKLMFGSGGRRRGSTPPQSGPRGYQPYNQQYAPSIVSRFSGPQRALSRQARASHQFDEIVLDQRSDAAEVIDQLYEIVNRYASATVADLYELVGLNATHTDNKWGWTDLSGAGVSRVRNGYLLDLPEPQPLD